MATGLIDIMKRAALDASEDAKFADLRYGKVISVKPLRIQITNQFILPESVLVVPKRLKTTDQLTRNDKVALLRKQGGQSYFILDKI